MSTDNFNIRFLHPGMIFQHFKRETLEPEDANANKYLYQIISVAQHSETQEKYVVYQALYGGFHTYIREAHMFNSWVDGAKYPDIQQKERFKMLSDGNFQFPVDCHKTYDDLKERY